MPSVTQDWVQDLTYMQQSVLLTAVRGPDGLPKYHPVKYLLRWYRRAILRSSFLGEVISDPWKDDGGSFLGASLDSGDRTSEQLQGLAWEPGMDNVLREYLATLDQIPLHFALHLMHAVEIVGYKHPDDRIRVWFLGMYVRLARDFHLTPETEAQLDHRLGDSREGWLAHADDATIA